MGHRALVARERPDGRYDLHRSQWGGADPSLARGLDREPWPPSGVGREPLVTGVARETLLVEHLDPLLHEALYVLPAEGAVRAYRTLWLGGLVESTDPAGLLVAVRWADPCDDALVRGWFAGARALAAAAREQGGLSGSAAATLLEARLRDWAGDRAVFRLPA